MEDAEKTMRRKVGLEIAELLVLWDWVGGGCVYI
jgi:hypothetical protein